MIAGEADLEEAISLQLEDKLVMHLVGWLVLAEAGPLIKQNNHPLPQTRGVCLILHRRPQPARTHMLKDQSKQALNGCKTYDNSIHTSTHLMQMSPFTNSSM